MGNSQSNTNNGSNFFSSMSNSNTQPTRNYGKGRLTQLIDYLVSIHNNDDSFEFGDSDDEFAAILRNLDPKVKNYLINAMNSGDNNANGTNVSTNGNSSVTQPTSERQLIERNILKALKDIYLTQSSSPAVNYGDKNDKDDKNDKNNKNNQQDKP